MVFSSVAQMSIKEVTFPSQREREMKQVFETVLMPPENILLYVILITYPIKTQILGRKK